MASFHKYILTYMYGCCTYKPIVGLLYNEETDWYCPAPCSVSRRAAGAPGSELFLRLSEPTCRCMGFYKHSSKYGSYDRSYTVATLPHLSLPIALQSAIIFNLALLFSCSLSRNESACRLVPIVVASFLISVRRCFLRIVRN